MLKEKVSKLEAKIDAIEKPYRDEDIISYDIGGNEYNAIDSSRVEVREIINETLGINFDNNNSTNVYRLGTVKENKTRPVLVKLSQVQIKHHIFQRAKLLKNLPYALCSIRKLHRTSHERKEGADSTLD
ncbi:hypothetical protein JTB14_001364 [Gonioctena quinquepunctata]|nr:hypothetical protein JTB14_001364 [Gonioctena quinquepunctata]